MTKETSMPVVEEEIIYDKPRVIIQKLQFDDPSMKIINQNNLLITFI